MKRTRVILSVLTALVLVALAGCGGAGGGASQPAAPSGAGQGSQAGAAPAQGSAGGGQAAAAPTQLRMMTGPQGGTWTPLGGAIAEMVQKEIPGVTITVQPGAGIANVKAIHEGKADLGFGNANSTADGYEGRPPFETATKDVLNLVTLYNQYFQMIVPADSGIKSVADLKGKRLATQPKGNTGEQITREVLEVYGLKYEDLAKVHFVSYSDAVELIKNRQADAFMLITTIPASSVMDLATGRAIRVLSLPDDKLAALRQKNKGYAKLVIPKGTYPGQDEDAVTVGTYTHLIASEKVPADLAYRITKLVVDNRDQLAAIASAIKGMTPEKMAVDVGVPFHPGAKRFFDEVLKK
ncbi:TAXI family TRAP transporter solute-binding subunit [Caldinitratiruptor microaerophilus]|uniref:C4-dicarboxylate ABC transporter n=1 Tax=Caldinitratiruptor microaerophilus TaxID=671077 RepID=A0AA35CKI8_9FIRM|nr:TAXI family TRAP transporter solute-binding subunit [Caldinitratiruptor microaerophilus]BDG60204.1 C4-dicarboxylate ABC transporter [Caldinitratiruptor microaerophilus]